MTNPTNRTNDESAVSQTGFLYHPEYLKHDTGYGHPERPTRLVSTLEALQANPVWGSLASLEPRYIADDDLLLIHDPVHVDRIRSVCELGGGLLDSDTPVCRQSYDIALLAAGAVFQGIDAVMSGDVKTAFAMVRPPGHHATPSRAMGFCLFNNTALGARYAQKTYGIERVLIVDWDVHHGNGTQDAFYEDPTVFFFSTHQHPLYPGTGMLNERGAGKGIGTTMNAPMPAGSGDADYIGVFESRLVPAAREFAPELVMISAGFDAHRDDPLASMNVTDDGFSALTDIVRGIAEEFCDGKIVSTLEGGYSLKALSSSVIAHLTQLSQS